MDELEQLQGGLAQRLAEKNGWSGFDLTEYNARVATVIKCGEALFSAAKNACEVGERGKIGYSALCVVDDDWIATVAKNYEVTVSE